MHYKIIGYYMDLFGPDFVRVKEVNGVYRFIYITRMYYFMQRDMASICFRYCFLNPSHQLEHILSLALPELCGKLQDDLLSPESVFYTYVDRAVKVTRDVNCVTDYLEESESQLLHVKSQGKKGLLYGVPISIKDSIDCKGYDSTLGLVKRLNQPAAADAVVVQVLKHQGAIPFVKTNVPQSLLNYDCSNLIFGQTVHPLDHSKTSGGSSGGECALITSGGSILGLGTDVGGSIRIPAAFCGICGFKATGNRISKKGIIPSIRGQKSVAAGVGPMARDVDSLVLCLRALLCSEMSRLDPTVPPLPFNEQVYSSCQPLRIGYYATDSYTMPSSSMRRAVLETKQLLEEAGHTLVPFKPCRVDHFMCNICPKGLCSDGCATFLESFKGESVDPNMKQSVFLAKLPNWIRSLLSWIIKPMSLRMSTFMRNLKESSVKELWELHTEIEEYSQEFIAEWKRLDLDVMLCPALGPAFKIGFPGRLSAAISYTILYNFLDFPAGVVPVTSVTKEDEEDQKSLRGHYNDMWDKVFVKAVEGAVGLPVAVQCVALPWKDELCLRFMKEVEKLTRKKENKH
ncbi:fatty-acid amide hydrolase 1-like isoform X2 [Rhineura floridana]|uniref:fatty-acid amide hydrolase 1-like isoform X2 n=1 Tax=Rhineura floridana TaxID=261503 RepID=UPI002AC86F9F|nr:fatty-acid amide hydrolase 1-like isoform X2 [Rhineura floridana]